MQDRLGLWQLALCPLPILTVIRARERKEPVDRKRIEWKLITDLSVVSRREAIEKLNSRALPYGCVVMSLAILPAECATPWLLPCRRPDRLSDNARCDLICNITQVVVEIGRYDCSDKQHTGIVARPACGACKLRAPSIEISA